MIKKVEIIPIAERKLTRRGIKRELVENTLLNPTQIVDGYGGRKVAHKKVLIDDKEYLLRVVYEETEGIYTVVTTYIISKIDRYWKEGE
ncbi:MAG: DUF4258 domain-containing protein [Nitrospirae bacterium]|nr:DUF4258 domain-containing protein [Nitrospirota bacterium]